MLNTPEQDPSVELLNEIYLNCKMGATAVDELLPNVADTAFASELQNTMMQHQTMVNRAATELRSRSKIPSERGALAKAGLWSSIKLHMFTNKNNNSHIAEMMIQGDTMGIINMTKALKSYNAADPEVVEIARTVITQEQDSIERMKQYL